MDEYESLSHTTWVGRDEEAIRAYIRNQEKEDQRPEHGTFRRSMPPGWLQTQGAASATPPTASSGSLPKAPALPGDTYQILEARSE